MLVNSEKVASKYISKSCHQNLEKLLALWSRFVLDKHSKGVSCRFTKSCPSIYGNLIGVNVWIISIFFV